LCFSTLIQVSRLFFNRNNPLGRGMYFSGYPEWALAASGAGTLMLGSSEEKFCGLDKAAFLIRYTCGFSLLFPCLSCFSKISASTVSLKRLRSNSQNAVVPLEAVVERATRMYRSGAFLHRYSAAGVDECVFEDAFEACEQILSNYRHL
jgi:hypothetical protein